MKKKIGRTPQNKPPFPRFFEKIGNTKNTFFPSWQKFRTSIFEKRPKIVDFWGPRPRKFFFDKLSLKKLRHTKNFGRDPPHRHFRAFFRKSRFAILFFPIFDCVFPINQMKSRFFSENETKSAVICP